jgi:hypothetical protein
VKLSLRGTDENDSDLREAAVHATVYRSLTKRSWCGDDLIYVVDHRPRFLLRPPVHTGRRPSLTVGPRAIYRLYT